MKKKISVLLAICLLLGAFSGLQAVTVAADSPANSPAEANLLAGLTPIEFYRASSSTLNNCTWTEAYLYSGYHAHGYSQRLGYNYSQAVVDTWKPYVDKNTDSNTEEGTVYALYGALVWVYELPDEYADYSLKDLTVKFGNLSGSAASGRFVVYTSSTIGSLFSATPVEVTVSSTTTATVPLSGNAKYVAIAACRTVDPDGQAFQIKDFCLTGFLSRNLLSGLLPTEFRQANAKYTDASQLDSNLETNETDVTVNGTLTRQRGYSPTWRPENKELYWASVLSYLTDGNEDVSLYIQDGWTGTNKDVLLIYELPVATDLTQVDLALTGYTHKADVYAAATREDLFTGEAVACFERANNGWVSGKGRNQDVSVKNVKYIGIQYRYLYQCYISEISIFGEPAIAFEGHSLVLADQIGVNFLMNLPYLTEEEKAESYMSFEISNADGVLETDFADAYTSGGKYGFTCFVSSVQMAETITPTFHYGLGLSVTGSGFSVKDYIDYVVANSGSFTSQVVTLVEALGDYGHYMQIYLDNKNNWEAGEDYTVMPRYRAYDYTSEIHAAYAGNLTSNAMSKSIDSTAVTGVNYNLNFDSGTYINVKLATGDTLTASTALGTKMIYGVSMGDYYLVRIPNLPISRLGDNFVITGAGTSNSAEFTVALSGLSYIRTILNRVSEPIAGAKDAMAALYDYYYAAIDYLTYNPSLDGELMYE